MQQNAAYGTRTKSISSGLEWLTIMLVRILPRPLLTLVVLLALAQLANAQSLSLPKVDDVAFFFQGGDLLAFNGTQGEWKKDTESNGDTLYMFGWGFETIFEMRTLDTRIGKIDIELSVGYDQLALRGRLFDKRFALRGAIRNLPSISAYAQHDNGFFIGAGTGLTSLSNVAAYENGKRAFTLSGDTFNLSFKSGYAFPIGPFVEVAYHFRKFYGLGFGAGAPPELPRTGDASGFVVSIGYQFGIQSPPPPPPKSESDASIRKESENQRKAFEPPAMNTPWPTQLVCINQAQSGWVVIDDRWDPIMCGGPSAQTSNVWVVMDTNNIPTTYPGVIEICANSPIPAGWRFVGDRWSPTRCGRPSLIEKNIKQLKRQ
jgi:hypothetical protein